MCFLRRKIHRTGVQMPSKSRTQLSQIAQPLWAEESSSEYLQTTYLWKRCRLHFVQQADRTLSRYTARSHQCTSQTRISQTVSQQLHLSMAECYGSRNRCH
ncbi:hypothetical protein BLNAU_11992 [Blattamonas nauphoetae]|uniref:Uncharacterized protein n=1 Tax=Blattamonas nauphoetae TaxID=2049346 RepID=A0ABQ9XKP4_9EUKA|nr:hypothetical protein BLNAU_11992 [Blattamonas nauphoetae]